MNEKYEAIIDALRDPRDISDDRELVLQMLEDSFADKYLDEPLRNTLDAIVEALAEEA